MSIATFGSSEGRRQSCERVVVGICTHDGPDRKLALLSVPHICELLSDSLVRGYIKGYLHLMNLNFMEPSEDTAQRGPDILIGCDYYWEFVLDETVRGEHGPVAVRTRLGWVLSGPVSPRSPGSSTNFVTHVLNVGTVTQSDVNKGLEQQLRAFWELESIGICHDESSVSQHLISQQASTLKMGGIIVEGSRTEPPG